MKAGCSLIGLIIFIVLFSFGLVGFVQNADITLSLTLLIVGAIGAIVCFLIMKLSKWANTSSGGKKKRKSHDNDDDDDDDDDDGDSDSDSGGGDSDGGGDGD